MPSRIWVVIGGKSTGGIVVRAGRDVKSAELPERLATGSFVEELQLEGERLRYSLLEGSTGPQTGWVSLTFKTNKLVRPAKEGEGPSQESQPPPQKGANWRIVVPAKPQRDAAAKWHVCHCVICEAGHMVPAIRICHGLASRSSIRKVTYLTNEFGAGKVQNWLTQRPDTTGKIELMAFTDGWGEKEQDQSNWFAQQENGYYHNEWNNQLWKYASTAVADLAFGPDKPDCFVVDGASFGYMGILEAFKLPMVHSTPLSSMVAPLMAFGPDLTAEDRARLFSGDLQNAAQEAAATMPLPEIDTRPPLEGGPMPNILHSFQLPPLLAAAFPPLPPMVIPVGIIADEVQLGQLPPDLEAFLARPGPPVVYVSLGSVAVLTEEQMLKFVEGLKAPKEWRILWSLRKSQQELLPGGVAALGDGFFVSPWLPQGELLQHPKVAAFLSHCGWGASGEAIMAGKPVICFPMFADQYSNALFLDFFGMSRTVHVEDASSMEGWQSRLLHLTGIRSSEVPHIREVFTVGELRETIRKVVTEKVYRQRARTTSYLSKKQGGVQQAAQEIEKWCAEFSKAKPVPMDPMEFAKFMVQDDEEAPEDGGELPERAAALEPAESLGEAPRARGAPEKTLEVPEEKLAAPSDAPTGGGEVDRKPCTAAVLDASPAEDHAAGAEANGEAKAEAKAEVSKKGGSMFDFDDLPAEDSSMSRAKESGEAKAEAKAEVSKKGGSMFDFDDLPAEDAAKRGEENGGAEAEAKAEVSKKGGSMFDFDDLPAEDAAKRGEENGGAEAEAKSEVSRKGDSMFDFDDLPAEDAATRGKENGEAKVEAEVGKKTGTLFDFDDLPADDGSAAEAKESSGAKADVLGAEGAARGGPRGPGIQRPSLGGSPPGPIPKSAATAPKAPEWLQPDGKPEKRNKILILTIPFAGHLVHMKRIAQWFSEYPTYEVHFGIMGLEAPKDLPKGLKVHLAEPQEYTGIVDSFTKNLKDLAKMPTEQAWRKGEAESWKQQGAGDTQPVRDVQKSQEEEEKLDFQKEGAKVIRFAIRLFMTAKPNVVLADSGFSVANFLQATCKTFGNAHLLFINSPGIKEAWITNYAKLHEDEKNKALAAGKTADPLKDFLPGGAGAYMPGGAAAGPMPGEPGYDPMKAVAPEYQMVFTIPGFQPFRLLQILKHMMELNLGMKQEAGSRDRSPHFLFPSASWMVQCKAEGRELFTGPLLPFPRVSGSRFQVGRNTLQTALGEPLSKWIFDGPCTDPIVYVAFGTIVQGFQSVVERVAAALQGGKWRVLWSLPTDMHQWLPKGLDKERWRVESFLPQLDILRCECVKCFMSHCGANSTIEAMCCGVPMVCHPFYMDQYDWAETVRNHLRAGIQVEKFGSDPSEIREAVQEVLGDPSYAANAREVAKRLRDHAEALERCLGPKMTSKAKVGPGVWVICAIILCLLKNEDPSTVFDIVNRISAAGG